MTLICGKVELVISGQKIITIIVASYLTYKKITGRYSEALPPLWLILRLGKFFFSGVFLLVHSDMGEVCVHLQHHDSLVEGEHLALVGAALYRADQIHGLHAAGGSQGTLAFLQKIYITIAGYIGLDFLLALASSLFTLYDHN